jgi:hypothetical protein
MHWTLNPKNAQAIAALWAVAAGLLAWIAHPPPIGPVVAGLLLGIPVGLLQRRALTENPNGFRQASTARQVRSALTSTRPGRLALRAQWLSAAILLVGSVVQAVSLGDAAPSSPAFGTIAGYLSLMLTRDLVALPGLRVLEIRDQSPG